MFLLIRWVRRLGNVLKGPFGSEGVVYRYLSNTPIVLITNCPTCNLLAEKVLMIYNRLSDSLVLWKGFPETGRNLGTFGVLGRPQVLDSADGTALEDEVIGGLSEANPRGPRRQFVKSIIGWNRHVLAGGPGIRYRFCGRRTH